MRLSATRISPSYFGRFINVNGSIKHQWAPIDTSIRTNATSVIPLSHHLLIFNLHIPVLPALDNCRLTHKKSLCLCGLWQQARMCELIVSNKEMLHLKFADCIFFPASISLQAATTIAHCTSECVRAFMHTCSCLEVVVLSQSLNDVLYQTSSFLCSSIFPSLYFRHELQRRR